MSAGRAQPSPAARPGSAAGWRTALPQRRAPWRIRLSLLASFSLLAMPAAPAAASYPYRCRWISEITPKAEILFSSTNGVGTYSGSLLYDGRRLLPFHEGTSQGYGSNWWAESLDPDQRPGDIVVFAGDVPIGGDPRLEGTERPGGSRRLLIVGLGARLWYGRDPAWRNNPLLLKAGRGFWRPTAGCRHLS